MFTGATTGQSVSVLWRHTILWRQNGGLPRYTCSAWRPVPGGGAGGATTHTTGCPVACLHCTTLPYRLPCRCLQACYCLGGRLHTGAYVYSWDSFTTHSGSLPVSHPCTSHFCLPYTYTLPFCSRNCRWEGLTSAMLYLHTTTGAHHLGGLWFSGCSPTPGPTPQWLPAGQAILCEEGGGRREEEACWERLTGLGLHGLHLQTGRPTHTHIGMEVPT